ncbi:MAG TPA: NAD-dependent epimerase/dehydratase family protein [Bacteroidales bacterium]|nr:NAD-dependent epimerase/dehydratase family protein [Bacteroidales bacterium]
MEIINKPTQVAVTGASGYVAGRLVEKLLQHGHTVHATVRNPHDRNAVGHLLALDGSATGRLKLFAADLLTEGAFDEAFKGCEIVFHTASPFFNKVKNPQRDLVEPAVLGTAHVLASVNRTASVKRVVLTSSVAAIIGDAADCLTFPGGIATEEQWNTTSSLKHQPYSYSKTMAERKAWEIAGQQQQWDLVVINPSFVIGPGLKAHSNAESFNIIRQMANGMLRFGAPDLAIGVVDVRDLAEAHYRAAFRPEASGRHIISARESSLLELATILRNTFGNRYPFPKRTLPNGIIWLMAPLAGLSRRMVSRNMGQPWKVDNSKGIRQLDMKYRPVEESITEMFDQIVKAGLV